MIVDTSAIVAILNGEPDSEVLLRALATDPDPKISAATTVELFAVSGARQGARETERVDAFLENFHVRTVPFDETQARLARAAYRDYGRGSGHPAHLNLGDCYSYALAAATGEPLLFVGCDFAATDITPAL